VDLPICLKLKLKLWDLPHTKEVTMNRILKIGMDVHSTNYTLCAMEPVFGADDRIYANIQVAPAARTSSDAEYPAKGSIMPASRNAVSCFARNV
jgi:hypothetical protein